MTSTAVVTEDSATIIAEDRHFQWGAVIAGAAAAVATGSLLALLGSGVGLAFASPTARTASAFVTAGAIYFFACQAFGYTVGGYLVGRLIGPETETSAEEEFRAAAHGFVMWALATGIGVLLAGSSVMGLAAARPEQAQPSAYWQDVLFRPAPNTPQVLSDKAEAGRILAADAVKNGGDDDDNARLADLVSRDAGLPAQAANDRVAQVKARMRQDADAARKAAASLALWTAFALLFGLILSIAAAIAARWMDDKVSFGFAPRR